MQASHFVIKTGEVYVHFIASDSINWSFKATLWVLESSPCIHKLLAAEAGILTSLFPV